MTVAGLDRCDNGGMNDMPMDLVDDEEIALRLDVTRSTVRAWLSRARAGKLPPFPDPVEEEPVSGARSIAGDRPMRRRYRWGDVVDWNENRLAGLSPGAQVRAGLEVTTAKRRRRSAAERLASAQAHATQEWTCVCGTTVRGNGGISGHRKHCPDYLASVA